MMAMMAPTGTTSDQKLMMSVQAVISNGTIIASKTKKFLQTSVTIGTNKIVCAHQPAANPNASST